MPYKIEGNCVKKVSTGETVPGGCHKTHEEALAHQRALMVNVKDSAIVEMSLRITKASYNKSDDAPRKWAAVDSDIDEDLYQEKMSLELYKDFISRIENKTPVPEPFRDVICESGWCGEMPYLSIAHFKAGESNKNVPGTVDSVYIDGTRLKSKGTLSDTPLGQKVFDALVYDLYKKKSDDTNHLPVRVSIGFLDLEHKHLSDVGGQEFTFERSAVGQICPLCAQGIGGKIYTKGQLVHLAMTRVPANPRTEMSVEKSMDITTKKQDAESIIGDLANELEEKSIANDVLVVRANENGTLPTPDPNPFGDCYNPNDGGWNQECINGVMSKWMADMRNEIGTTVKSLIDEVVEDARRKDVSPADKKRAEKEYGDVEYADAANSKYPIDTEEHIRAAWNYIHQERNANKYPDKGAAIKRKILAAWKKKIGGQPPSVEKSQLEDAMDTENVEKMTLGGESVEQKPFNYAGINGSGNNTVPAPVKAKTDDESSEEDTKGDEKEMPMHKSALDVAFETLKSLVEKRAGVEDVNKAFAELGTAVESAYAPEPKQLDPNDIASIVKSAVEQAVTPLRIELATLKASQVQNAQSSNVVKSKALTLNGYARPEDLVQKANVSTQPVRKLSQIEKLARKSTGLPVE